MLSTTIDRESYLAESATGDAAEFDKTFPAGESCRFVLDNLRGHVAVVAWDRPEIHVHARRKRGRSDEQFEATRIEWEEQGSTLLMRTILDPTAQFQERGVVSGVAAEIFRTFGDLLRSAGKPVEVDYSVSVPRGCAVDLKGVSSSLAIEGLASTSSANSVSGDVAVVNHRGDLRLQTVSGTISTHGVDGAIHVESVSGELRLEGHATALAAKTVSGNIALDGALSATGAYEFRTVSGDVSLQIPAQTTASIAVRGVSCDVESQLPCSVSRDARWPGSREWQGTLNGGGAPIQFQTVSGCLRLRQLADADRSVVVEMVAPAPIAGASLPDEPVTTAELPVADAIEPSADTVPSDDDRAAMGVLQALERGEINVDDALRQLDQLRRQAE